MAQANNVHVAAVVADGDEERFRFKVGYLAGDVQRGVLLRRRLARLLLQLDHAGRLLLDRRQHQRRAQLGQLRVYAETDRSKLAAADIHRVVVVVVAVVVVIYRMFITLNARDVNRAIFGRPLQVTVGSMLYWTVVL